MGFVAERGIGVFGLNKQSEPVGPGTYLYQVPLRGAVTELKISEEGEAKIKETDILGNPLTWTYIKGQVNKTPVPFVAPDQEMTLLRWK